MSKRMLLYSLLVAPSVIFGSNQDLDVQAGELYSKEGVFVGEFLNEAGFVDLIINQLNAKELANRDQQQGDGILYGVISRKCMKQKEMPFDFIFPEAKDYKITSPKLYATLEDSLKSAEVATLFSKGFSRNEIFAIGFDTKKNDMISLYSLDRVLLADTTDKTFKPTKEWNPTCRYIS